MKSINYLLFYIFFLFSVFNFSQQIGEYTSDVNTMLLLHLNETTGNTAYDASSYSNDGTIFGNETSEGRFNAGRKFPTNNTDIGIQLPNSVSLNITGPLTLEAWIKADGYETSGAGIIQHDEYQLALGSFGSSGLLQLFRHVGNDWVIYQSDVQIPLNEWVHVAGVWDGFNAVLYINGAQVTFTTVTNTYTSVGTPRVATHEGSSVNPTTSILIDEIRISDTTRIITSLEEKSSALASDFKLFQNYPNPFNPSTTITYSIPQTQKVTLKVFDVLGNEIAILVNEEKTAGNYEVNFDGIDLASGIYFYKL